MGSNQVPTLTGDVVSDKLPNLPKSYLFSKGTGLLVELTCNTFSTAMITSF